ncbi:antibiotic biosynthesis monooxygenase [Actinomadura scrupuli]|uniref:antibiotic biosynthesis monooxygenase n=1 Tax=Actinomadura scrupuli TaxID=559629 RepID=UPI003D981E9F
MESPASIGLNGNVASVVIYLKVREGREEEYRHWQDRIDAVARGFAGFEDTEVYPAGPDQPGAWVVVYRFRDVGLLTAWLDSTARRELLDEGLPLFDGPAKQEVLTGGAPSREVVTAVISHRVRPGREEEFARWQDRVRRAQEKFPGFLGSELFSPVPGIQDNWVAVVRFATRVHLDEWLESDERARLLEQGRGDFVSYDVRKIKSAFSGWFRFDGHEKGTVPDWKQAMSVILALYPTVMILNLTLGRGLAAAGAPGYLALFLGNVVSVAVLTWPLMPLVNRMLAFWLVPGRAGSLRAEVAGTAVVVVCCLAFVTVFGLTTS